MNSNFVYKMPAPEIATLIEAEPFPEVSCSPSGNRIALFERVCHQSLTQCPENELRMAGLCIDSAAHAPSRDGKIFQRIRFVSLMGNRNESVCDLTDYRSRLLESQWSPDGQSLACALAHDSGVDLVIINAVTGSMNTLVGSRLNCLYGASFHWFPEGNSLIVKLIPKRKRPVSTENNSIGPAIFESSEAASPARTYPDALRTPQNADLLEHYLLSEIYRISINGQMLKIRDAGMIVQAHPSPDGNYLLMRHIERPFSLHLRIDRFPQRFEVIDMKGATVRDVGCRPLDEQRLVGRDAAPRGIITADWRPDQPSTVYWVETLDGGDFRIQTQERTRVHQWAVGSNDLTREIITLGYRFTGIWWNWQGHCLVAEEWCKNRNRRIWLIPGDATGQGIVKLFDYSSEDRYADPGSPLLRHSASGGMLMTSLRNGKEIILSGTGAGKDGERPFLDILDVDTLQKRRLWQANKEYYELPVAVIDENETSIVTIRESRHEAPNLFILKVGNKSPAPITCYPDPYPCLAGATKEIVTYQREDGLRLNAELHLPAGFDRRKGPAAVLVWAYPREFKNSASASQVNGSPNKFPRLTWGSPLYWLARNYVILAGPSMPIIGEGSDEPNDSYLDQLTMNARAFVKYLTTSGIGDPNRIVIGGQSYGAFMAVNLLAHTDLFCGGIARNGSYNRTLTPFGFQYEERNFWEAKETYFVMSPYLFAEKINVPLLLLHGAEDTNPGTNPMQSDFLFKALKGLGKTARFVLFPNEGHNFRYQESIMHMSWEIDQWLSRYAGGIGV